MTGGGTADAVVVNDSAAARVVRVHAVRVADDDGTHQARITPHEVGSWVSKANESYARGSMRFEFEVNENGPDWSDINDILINQMEGEGDSQWQEEKQAANDEAARHPGKLVIFFRWGANNDNPTGGGFSAGPERYNFVAMPGFNDTGVACGGGAQNIGLLAHELGHYFGLGHTFAADFSDQSAAQTYFTNHGNDPTIFDGDGLSDTPPDPLIASFQCGRNPASVTLNGQVFRLPRTNAMSYYHPDNSVSTEVRTFSRQQIHRAQAGFAVRFPF